MTRRARWIALLVVLLTPGSASAVGIGVDLTGVWISPNDPAFKSAIGDGSTGLFETRLLGRVWSGLVIEGGYSYGDVDGYLHGGTRSNLELHGALLGLRWQQKLVPWLDVYGRADGLFRWGRLTVTDSVATLTSDGVCGGAEVAAGLEIHLPASVFFDAPTASQEDLAIGLTVDAGYAWLSDLKLEGAEPGGITDLGGMSLSTAVVRIGAVLWF